MSELPGDDDFDEFLSKEEKNGSEVEDNQDCPKLIFIVSVIREKIRFINDLMKVSTETYKQLPDDDSLKNDFKKFITDLMANSNRAMDQLDFTLIEDDSEGDE
jgi:predicted nucleotide-binding protein (sugar kinase/HSP70/actin superfamily)